MAFLAPLFFAGLAAISIPVLVHLIQRERKRVVEFPSLMFVRRIPYKSVQRRRIHNWLLLAIRLAAQTLLGSAKMVIETGLHPGALKDMVTSPGGTTEAALKVLMGEDGLVPLMRRAIEAATKRGKELGKG